MTLPSNAAMPQYPFPADARTFDFEFIRMAQLCSAFGEGIAPADQTKDSTISGSGLNRATDLEVTTGGSGLTLSVAAGNAWVQGDSRATQGLYFCMLPTAVAVTVGAANATNPRIDQVVLKVEDADVTGSLTQWSIAVVAGTATAGATLTNLTGAAALPVNCLRLAYVLVPAAFTGPFVSATHVLDVRFFAYRPGRIVQRSIVTTNSGNMPGDIASLIVLGNGVNELSVDYLQHHVNNTAGAYNAYGIYDVAAAGGTTLGNYTCVVPTAGLQCYAPLLQCRIPVFTGRKTLYVNASASAGIGYSFATATQPRTMIARYA